MSTPQQQPQGGGDNTPKRIPLASSLGNRSESANVDSRIVNGYVEKTEQGEYHIYKRPVLTLYSSVAPNGYSGLGVVNWNGILYSIWGNNFYSGTTFIGNVDNSAAYTFSSTLGATPSLFFQNGSHYYYYNTSAGLQPITPGSFSQTDPGCVYLDGTMYVMDPGCNIWGSALNNVSTGNWNAANVIVAQSEPCPGVALWKQLVYAVAFKTYSTEMFYDAGNATGSPLGAVPGQKLNYGCKDARSIAEVSGVLLWVDQIREGGMSIRIMDQLTAQPCSTPQVERILQGADTANYFSGPVWAWTGKIDGHTFYILTISGLGYSLVYDLTQKMWYEWQNTSGSYVQVVASTFINGRTICQGAFDGNLYYLNTQSGVELGVNVQTDVYTPEFDGGVRRRKTIDKMRIIGDVYPGNVLQIRVSDDDFSSWSQFRNVDMSQADPYLINCGTFHRRVWHIRNNTSVPGRIVQAIEPEIEIGDL